jgi:hypothetical protein
MMRIHTMMLKTHLPLTTHDRSDHFDGQTCGPSLGPARKRKRLE